MKNVESTHEGPISKGDRNTNSNEVNNKEKVKDSIKKDDMNALEKQKNNHNNINDNIKGKINTNMNKSTPVEIKD